MTTIDEVLYSILISDPGISAMVGSRIYPAELPLDCEFPAIAYFSVSDPYNRIARHPRYQISCFSKDFLEAKQLKQAVEAALNGYSGTQNGVNIEIIVPIDSIDLYNSETGVYHIPYDFKIIYR